ncbi:hypothetical protein GCM10008097_20210 [Mycetocola manganoxydans]|nr:hypothetical protein GCM10008097_20210 [Mycetocola manganoxydans]
MFDGPAEVEQGCGVIGDGCSGESEALAAHQRLSIPERQHPAGGIAHQFGEQVGTDADVSITIHGTSSERKVRERTKIEQKHSHLQGRGE